MNKKKPEETIDDNIVETEVLKVKKPYNKFMLMLNTAIVVIIVLILGFSLILQNEKYKKMFVDFVVSLEQIEDISSIKSEITKIKESLENNLETNKQVAKTEQSINKLNERFDFLEQTNLNIIQSKADVALILGVIQRTDTIENKLNKISEVSNQGALIATAAMLIKDSADKGNSFLYEFSILKELTKNEKTIEKQIKTIESFTEQGIKTEVFLYTMFENIYSLYLLENSEETYLEEDDNISKFNKTLGKIITIKVKDSNKQTGEITKIEEVNLDIIAKLVQNKETKKALEELEKEEYTALIKDNELLQNWIKQVKEREIFLNTISQISAYSLGIMRANNL